MNALKGSTQPLLAFGLLAVAGLLIKPAQDAMLGLFGRKTTAVMTNVPGPRERLKFLGSTLEQSMFWVPQSGDIGLGVSVLSYGGGVQFGVISDTVLCPEPQRIIDEFEPEFAKRAFNRHASGRLGVKDVLEVERRTRMTPGLLRERARGVQPDHPLPRRDGLAIPAQAGQRRPDVEMRRHMALVVRALLEERVLIQDERYRAYCARVGWHLMPGVF